MCAVKYVYNNDELYGGKPHTCSIKTYIFCTILEYIVYEWMNSYHTIRKLCESMHVCVYGIKHILLCNADRWWKFVARHFFKDIYLSAENNNIYL